MERVFRTYEARKAERGLVDFEDLLELAIRLFDEDEAALAAFRERYRAFTVDEYQDVNLLQQSLLERWLGDRDDLCVVGDDYQSIYSFTGATPEYLLAMPDALSRRARRAARGELPLDAGDPLGREPARARAGRLGEGAARRPARRRGAAGPRAARPADRGRVRRRPGAPPRRRGRPVRGDGGPLPPERALGGLRGGVRARRDPVPGARRGVHPAAGRAADAAAAARPAGRLGASARSRRS